MATGTGDQIGGSLRSMLPVSQRELVETSSPPFIAVCRRHSNWGRWVQPLSARRALCLPPCNLHPAAARRHGTLQLSMSLALVASCFAFGPPLRGLLTRRPVATAFAASAPRASRLAAAPRYRQATAMAAAGDSCGAGVSWDLVADKARYAHAYAERECIACVARR